MRSCWDEWSRAMNSRGRDTPRPGLEKGRGCRGLGVSSAMRMVGWLMMHNWMIRDRASYDAEGPAYM